MFDGFCVGSSVCSSRVVEGFILFHGLLRLFADLFCCRSSEIFPGYCILAVLLDLVLVGSMKQIYELKVKPAAGNLKNLCL